MAEQSEITIGVNAKELDAFALRLQALTQRMTELQGAIRHTQQQAGNFAREQAEQGTSVLQRAAAERAGALSALTRATQTSLTQQQRQALGSAATETLPRWEPTADQLRRSRAYQDYMRQARTALAEGREPRNAQEFGLSPNLPLVSRELPPLREPTPERLRRAGIERVPPEELERGRGGAGGAPGGGGGAGVGAGADRGGLGGGGAGGPAGGGAVGGAVSRGGGGNIVPWLGRTAGRIGALAAGFGVVEFLREGMGTYEDRFRGLLQIGYQLDTQWGRLAGTLDHWRTTFRLTTRDALTAMRVMAATTGMDPARMTGALAVGRAYGFEQEAPGLFASLSMLGANRVPNLAELTGQYTQQIRGRSNISQQRYLSQIQQIAEVGGLRAAPLGEGDYGLIAQRFIGMGGRYEANPAAAYAEQYARLEAPAGEFGMGGRYTALAELARRQRYLRLGPNELIDIRNPLGVVAAMQQGAQIREVQRAYFEQAQRLGGGDETRGIQAYMHLANIENVRQATLEYRSFTAGRQPQRADLAEEQANIDRVRQRATEDETARQGEMLRRRDIDQEIAAETELMKRLEAAQSNLLETVGKGVKTYEDTHSIVQAFGKALDTINGKTLEFGGWMTTFVGLLTANPLLIGAGVSALGGAGMKTGALEGTPLPSPTPGIGLTQYGPFTMPSLQSDPSRRPRTPG